MPRALLVVTSATPQLYSDGKRTGAFWAEIAHPYDVFKEAGWDVDVASETGTTGLDEHSISPDMLKQTQAEDSYNNKQHPLHNILNSGLKRGKDVNASDYDAIFFSAGHGSIYDYPKAQYLGNVASQLYTKGKPVAAVCHAPAIFEAAKDPKSGDSIAKGRKITGFTYRGEEQVGVVDKLKEDGVDWPEKIAQKIGAIWQEPEDPWGDFTVVDGNILTGVNPASGASLAKKTVQAAKV